MKKELFTKYAQIKSDIKRLTSEAKELEPLVLEDMIKAEAERVRSDMGLFSITKSLTWKFSDAVTDIEEILNEELATTIKLLEESQAEKKKFIEATKEKEREDGIATFTEKVGLRFSEAKKDEKVDEKVEIKI